MSPTPTTIPMTQTLNFVILNISHLFSPCKYYYHTQHIFLEINKTLYISKTLLVVGTIMTLF
jgi:hypothetical protein